MLLATLPTLVSDKDVSLSEKILSHPIVDAVRYNTGGASPYIPKEIIEKLVRLRKYGKKIYIDLEGRQIRIARWTPFSAGSVVLNRSLDIELPGKIYFRGLGWFNILSAGKRKIFFDSAVSASRYYLGESQSVHIVAKKVRVNGYLGGLDISFIDAAIKTGIKTFMLSFVESFDDIAQFYETFGSCDKDGIGPPEIVTKIESLKGIEFIKNLSPDLLSDFRLMAARDDLFLAHVDNKRNFLDSLQLIVSKDPQAILASKIMSGLESGDGLTVGDISDMALMAKIGYKNFMLSDELSRKFDWVVEDWWHTVAPIIKKVKNE